MKKNTSFSHSNQYSIFNIRYLKTGSIFFSLLFLSACHSPQPKTLRIATAANMQFAMQEIASTFTQQTNISCDLIISSSGKLTAQIKEGAPYDVLVAANMKYPREVHNSGLAANHPKVYAHGKLVLWSFRENQNLSIETLSDKAVRHIALANPKTAPYGAAAIEVLQHYKLYEPIKPKLVYGESIAQTNQFITSQSADAGFTALSVVRSPRMKGQGKWVELDSAIYQPIEQGVVILQQKKKDLSDAQKFYDFLFSKDAKQILKDFGYSVNE